MVTLAIGALLYPWLAFAHGLAFRLLPGQPTYWSSPFTMLFYSAAYTALYRRRLWITVAMLIAYVVAATAVLLALVAAVVLIAKSAGWVPDHPKAKISAPARRE
jgi:hypothetical protein